MLETVKSDHERIEIPVGALKLLDGVRVLGGGAMGPLSGAGGCGRSVSSSLRALAMGFFCKWLGFEVEGGSGVEGGKLAVFCRDIGVVEHVRQTCRKYGNGMSISYHEHMSWAHGALSGVGCSGPISTYPKL